MNRLKIILTESATLHDMMIGTALTNMIILVASVIICSDKKGAVVAVLAGFAVSIFYLIHMAVTVDDAMCLDEKGAATVMRKSMIIRYIVVCVVIALVSYFKIANPVVCVFSVLSIKTGAYFQPAVHSILKRIGFYGDENLSEDEEETEVR